MLLRRFVELLTPVECLGCGREGSVLCDDCVGKSALAKTQVCYVCGLASPDGATCDGCAEVVELSGASVGAHYDGAVKDMIWRLKFSRLRAAAEPAAELIVRALPERRFDVVTAVPVSPERYRERGYNQAELIGRFVASRLHAPFTPLLGRLTSAHQLGQGRTERLMQIKGAFYARRPVPGERILVIDDVITTGATLGECAQTLRAAGADEVWGGAVARH